MKLDWMMNRSALTKSVKGKEQMIVFITVDAMKKVTRADIFAPDGDAMNTVVAKAMMEGDADISYYSSLEEAMEAAEKDVEKWQKYGFLSVVDDTGEVCDHPPDRACPLCYEPERSL